MDAELRNSVMVDPLHDYTVLSLLRRTFRGVKKTSNTKQSDMELIQTHLKSLANESTDKLLEQAKTILNRNTEHGDSELPCPVQSDEEDGAIVGKAKGRAQERRPALGRKRARFSLKPITSSQPNLNENMKLNIDQLQDPEEFFSAYEKLENAEKELQKQRGDIPTGSTKRDLSMTARSRRPGILGKTVGYKHRYSSVGADSSEVLSSEEAFETDNPSQSSDILNIETTVQQGQTSESECMDFVPGKDSVADAENRVNRLLDELLSVSCTDLDGDRAVPFLQERLQIKPINLDKLCLPDIDRLRRSNVRRSVEPLDRSRNALSDVDNNIRRLRNKTSAESHQVVNSSMNERTSPTSPKSPFASMSLLKKRISQTVLTSSPFSFRNIDISPVRNASHVGGRDKKDHSPAVDCDHSEPSHTTAEELNWKGLNVSRKFQPGMLVEDDTAGTVSEKLVMENSACPLDMPLDVNPNISSTDMDIRSSRPDGVLEDKVEDIFQETATSEHEDSGREGLPNMDYSGSQLDELRSTVGEHRPKDVVLQTADILPEQITEVEDMGTEALASEQQELGVEGLPSGDESNATAGEHQPKHGVSQSCETYPEPYLKEQRKRKTPPNRSKRGEVFRRKSLSGAGGKQESVGRRSTRIRTRPLEYWRGEHRPEDGNSQAADILSEQNNEVEDVRPEAVASEQQELGIEDLPSRDMDCSGSQLDLSSSTAGECRPKDDVSQATDILPKQNNETYEEPSLREQRKQKEAPRNKSRKKEVSQRKSLAGAGTKWESGVRRSTRIRTRPLEYWKGERFLYGRVHESLLTVIGLKYESPPKSKKEKPSFKVKSYVSDEYKELVDKAALY